ncbi:sulfurtransferase [uncultured Photobacterium sp.]|uniref:sulfurtransferase n=1 Tax=uncultured Photobacterium sp. TaxID=173973 RepID=UPI00263465F5|nr:rhodanese-like domain-containing protein [uncultured Photobacterium sp.]
MSSALLPCSLVSVQWLAEYLNTPDVVVLDASWFLPGSDRNPQQEWREKRIPGARYFDFDNKIAAPDTELPHMLPSAELFSHAVSELGIKQHDTIVVYDSQGMFSAPRVWWMFRAMGHDSVAVLDGGLPAWEKAELGFESGTAEQPDMTDYQATYQSQWVIDADELNLRLAAQDTVVLDARSASRFYGTQPEPRQGVRSGHMPNAKSLPFSQLIQDGYFLDVEQLSKRFDALTEPDQKLIFSCGSGVTACILALAAELTGRSQLTVYDGSWSEWGRKLKYPVVR